MIAFICLFFPAVLLCYVRELAFEKSPVKCQKSKKCYIVEYTSGCMALNLVLLLVLAFLRHNTTEIYDKLNESSVFAIKYLLLSILIAILEPLIEKRIKGRIKLDFAVKPWIPSISPAIQTRMVYLYATGAFMLHFIRTFNHSFWCDEGLAINVIYMTWGEMLQYVAKMGHCPLHYVLLWLLAKVLPHSGFLYHFISVVPYLLILTITVLVISRQFGKVTAITLITLSTFLENAVTYNLEVRAYSWCQLFLLLAFLTSYQIFRKGRLEYYVALCFFSLGAVYSHYFALASAGIIYMFLFFYLVMIRIKETWKLVLSGCGVLAGISPWLLYCYRIQGEVMHNYRLSEVGWLECFRFVFQSKHSLLILLLFLAVLFLVFLHESGIIQVSNMDKGKIAVVVSFPVRRGWLTYEHIWLISGVCAAVGTIVLSKLISFLVFPIIWLRYLYPSFIMIWLVFGICLSKLPWRRIILTLFCCAVIITCFPSYLSTVKDEIMTEKLLNQTLEATKEMDAGDRIITDISHLGHVYETTSGHYCWTVGQVYYPNTEVLTFEGMKIPEFGFDKENWLFLTKGLSDELAAWLAERNCIAEPIIEKGCLGTYRLSVYKVIKK